ncbi:MAG TPA: hypothetical protein VFS19_00620 [Planctomycetota bacterium]|nr:hypothetical protein [Planctomycetota bacterium]
MTERIALGLACAAILVSVASLFLIGNKLLDLHGRIAVLESRGSHAPAPPPAPREPDDREVQPPSERVKIREITDKESEDHLDALVKLLDLDAITAAKVREAFTEEFMYYADGVVRAYEALKGNAPKGDDAWLTSREFRKGMTDRIAATDQVVRPLLDPARTARFEHWRTDLKKSRYELE